MVDLALAGDVMLGRLMNDAMRAAGCRAPWSGVLPLIERADGLFFNLECAVCGALPEWEPVRKTFHFRLDPEHLEALLVPGVEAVTLANNHTLDFDVDGLLETLDHLDRLGIAHVGAGRDLAEAEAPVVVPVGDLHVGLVAAADHPREWAAGRGRPGINWLDPETREGTTRAAHLVASARERGADVVVLALHWGPNMRRTPPPSFRRFARATLDAGADVVWGTSAHLFQGIEYHTEGVVLYDTGDFLDDYAVDPHERNDVSFLFTVSLERGRAGPVALDPVLIARCSTRPAPPGDAFAAAERMMELSKEFGTQIERRGRAWLAVEPDGTPRRS